MLIVTRRKGQRIVLGHDIELVITDITRSGVKIGIVAPNSLSILRGEVRDAVEEANRASLDSSFECPEQAVLPTTEEPVPVAVDAIATPAPSAARPALSER
jgi:carbon storage regulator